MKYLKMSHRQPAMSAIRHSCQRKTAMHRHRTGSVQTAMTVRSVNITWNMRVLQNIWFAIRSNAVVKVAMNPPKRGTIAAILMGP